MVNGHSAGGGQYSGSAKGRCARLGAVLLPVLLGLTGATAVAASPYGIGDCPASYSACLEAWKNRRLGELRSATGYLNLAGLYWLKSGRSTFGSDADNDLVFPAAAPGRIGIFRREGERIFMRVQPTVAVSVNGHEVESAWMPDDQTGRPAVAELGSLAWTVIRRADRFAVRLRDFENPALDSFAGIEYFAARDAMRVTATIERYATPRIVRVDTVVDGLDYNPTSPGVLRFDLNGESFDLEVYDIGTELLIVFGDRTSGVTTYPAGRFLYAPLPDEYGQTVLDFNTAQNPPCAFNEFATCPIAAPRNRLRIPVAAGERYSLH